jgi:hypothetical protein
LQRSVKGVKVGVKKMRLNGGQNLVTTTRDNLVPTKSKKL